MKGLFGMVTLASAADFILSMKGAPLPATIWAQPVAGDTVAVYVSFDNGATYHAWALGAVTAAAYDTLTGGVTHVKFKRTAGSGTTSTGGIC